MCAVCRWMDGEKLIESRASDVRELCNTLLNAYLIQLLDTGFLHADPHPGNLIRTPGEPRHQAAACAVVSKHAVLLRFA